MSLLSGTTLTGCNSIPDFIPTGTQTVFFQASAPSSWTRVTNDNADNRMLRVVSTGGGTVGGSSSPILNNVVPAHTHSFTTGGISANHGHTGTTNIQSNNHIHFYNDPRLQFERENGGQVAATSTYGAGTSGISENHVHGFGTGGVSSNHSHSGTTDNGSSGTNWSPRYVDMILCSKN